MRHLSTRTGELYLSSRGYDDCSTSVFGAASSVVLMDPFQSLLRQRQLQQQASRQASQLQHATDYWNVVEDRHRHGEPAQRATVAAPVSRASVVAKDPVTQEPIAVVTAPAPSSTGRKITLNVEPLAVALR